MVSLEVTQLITGKAPPSFHLLGLHSMSHLHLEDRIIGYGLLQITGDVQPFIIFLRQLVAIRVCLLLQWRLRMARAIFLDLRDGGSKGHGLMESWLITRGMAISLRLTGGQTGTLAFQPLVTGYISFISFDGLIHLLWSQFASILDYLRVQDMPYFLMDSIHGNLILEELKLSAVSSSF